MEAADLLRREGQIGTPEIQIKKQSQKMRGAAFTILLLLSLSQGEALLCNYCFSNGCDLCTPARTQRCSELQNACGAIILQAPCSNSFRQCMNFTVCQGFMKTPGAFAKCCGTDRCN